MKLRSLEVFSQYSAFYLWFVHSEARLPSSARLFRRFRAAGANGRLDLSPEIHGKPRIVSLLVGETQLTGCLKVLVIKWSVGVGRRYPVTIQDTVYEANVSA